MANCYFCGGMCDSTLEGGPHHGRPCCECCFSKRQRRELKRKNRQQTVDAWNALERSAEAREIKDQYDLGLIGRMYHDASYYEE